MRTLLPVGSVALVCAGLLCTLSPHATAVVSNAVAPHFTVATGDSRSVSQPSVASTCESLSATLATSDREFSSAQESSPPDTARIQSALNSCAGTGKAVELTASGSDTAFLAGSLTVGKGEFLVVDTGVTLYASRDAADYQVSGKPTCGTVNADEGGCTAFITVDGASSGIEGTTSSAGRQGEIDGRGDLDIIGQSVSWWDVSNEAQSAGENENDPRLIQANDSNNFTLYDIDLVNSPNFHVDYSDGNGFTAWGVRIKTPATARNTDGIDPSGATNVTIEDSYIQDGDDGIAIKGGTASSDITIKDDHFYGTHGISIGSETNGGVSNVLVEDNTVQGTDSAGNTSSSDNGIRIKSDSSAGGTVQQITYADTCLSGVKYLLDFDPNYSSGNGSAIPYFTDIVVNGVKSTSSASGAESVLDGYSSSKLLGLTLENVSLDSTKTTAEYASIGTYDANITASGTDVTVSSVSGSGSVPSCSFPSYPSL